MPKIYKNRITLDSLDDWESALATFCDSVEIMPMLAPTAEHILAFVDHYHDELGAIVRSSFEKEINRAKDPETLRTLQENLPRALVEAKGTAAINVIYGAFGLLEPGAFQPRFEPDRQMIDQDVSRLPVEISDPHNSAQKDHRA